MENNIWHVLNIFPMYPGWQLANKSDTCLKTIINIQNDEYIII